MFSGNNNKFSSLLDNTITVTPVKMEVDESNSYPTTSGSIASAATSKRPAHTTNSTSMPAITAFTSAVATPKDVKSAKQSRLMVHKTPPTIDTFWPTIINEVKTIQQVDAKHQALPLARIKKIMKLDENAKMIAAEAPLLFAKACEYFIQELTMRAWVHTEDNKRRTLQRSDIAQAIANYDQFDFLIDIVPREDIKPSSSSSSNATSSQSTKKETQGPVTTATATTVSIPANTIKVEAPQMITYGTLSQAEALAAAAQQHLQQPQQLQILQQTSSQAQPQQLQYFITIPGQHGQHQLVQQLQLQQPQLQQLPNGLTLATTAGNQQLAGLNIVTPQPQQLILTAGPNGQLTATPAPSAAAAQQQQQTTILQNLAQQQQHQQHQLGNQQQIQLLHQVVSPTGELTNVPISITANQLQLLRLQMQQQQQQQQHQQQQQTQQVIIPTHCVTAGSAQQLLQLGAAGTVTSTTSPNTNTNNNATIQLGQVQITHFPQQQQSQHNQQQQHQNSASGGTNIFLNTSQQQNTNSVVSTDRNLGSTYRTNC